MILAASAAKYAAKKRREAERQRKISAAGREIGAIPPVADAARRARAERSLQYFLDTYFPDVFTIAWSPDHKRIIKAMQEGIVEGGLQALAMPRGSGKTSIAEAAALWAVLTGHRRFLLLVAATSTLAAEICRNIKAHLESNERLAADFPEVCWPILKLEGINQRAAGQLQGGRKTHLKFTARKIVLPSIADSASSGAVITCTGITGAMRGLAHVTPDGHRIRPDFVLLDDPQTDASARSPKQTRQRLAILTNTILQMAGPTTSIAAVCCCTVIEPDDLADQLLDRDKFPQWKSDRIPLLYAMPDKMDLWDEYARLRTVDLRADLKTTPNATKYYKAHRKAMDAGCRPYWPGRKLSHQLSAIQYAMDLFYTNPSGFMAEHQQRPRRETAASRPTSDQLLQRIYDLEPGRVPLESELLTFAIDQQNTALYWMVCAWIKPTMRGVIIDYGAWPEQRAPYFTLGTLRRTFKDVLPGMTPQAQVSAALASLLTMLTEAGRYVREDGLAMNLSRGLVDSGQGVFTDTIYEFCRLTPHRGILFPSKGTGIKADKQPISAWRLQPGTVRGEEFILGRPESNRAVRLLTYDTYHWKTRVDQSLACPAENPGAILLHGPAYHPTHPMLVDHLHSESPTATEGRGRVVQVYKQRPGTENHWWDTLIMNRVAAAYEMIGMRTEGKPPRSGAKTLAI